MSQARASLFILLFFLAGCAHDTSRAEIDSLGKQLTVVTNRSNAIKKENLDLRRELELFRKSQDIDTKKFITALYIFEEKFADDIAGQEIWVRITDRGLVLTVSAEKMFVSGSDALSPEGKSLLDKVFDICKTEFPTNYIYIEGHTDNQSLAVFEWKSDRDFSFARALSVVRYFTNNKGMDPLRLSASGFGQYRPKATNDTKEGRRLNRRIEIVISQQRLRHILYK
jgi:chemotaxis protein MotB